MGIQDFISASEASTFTGVSPQTLQRFAEAGYLKIENDADGLPLFSKPELIDVFGLEELESAARSSTSLSPTQEPEKIIDGSIQGGCFVARTGTEQVTGTEQIPPSAGQANADQDAGAPRNKVIVSLSNDHVVAESGENAGKSAAIASLQDAAMPASVAQELRDLQREVARLGALSLLQDKLLETREAEIRDLKAERSWIKARIERLEEKSDRDQLLLLSETQVVRKLITMQQEKRSVLRAALDWLGITAPISAPQQTIELKRPESFTPQDSQSAPGATHQTAKAA